jgi:hypothetical protein
MSGIEPFAVPFFLQSFGGYLLGLLIVLSGFYFLLKEEIKREEDYDRD